jgi:hypothetical protein
MRWTEYMASMGEMRNAYRILIENPECQRPIGRPRRKQKDDIKWKLKGREFEVDWILLSREKGPLRTSFECDNSTFLSLKEGGEFLEN